MSDELLTQFLRRNLSISKARDANGKIIGEEIRVLFLDQDLDAFRPYLPHPMNVDGGYDGK